MTCKEIQAMMPEILREPGKHPEAEKHIETCEACRNELAFIRSLQQELRGAFPQPPLTETIPRRIKVMRKVRYRTLRRYGIYAAAAAAVIVLTFLLPSLFSTQDRTPEMYTYYETETLEAMMAADLSEGMRISDEAIALYLIENAPMNTLEDLSF